MIRHNDTKQERKALFLESVELELDNATKNLLDATARLSWTDEPSIGSIDKWLDVTNAAVRELRAARVRTMQTVRA